MSATTAPSRDAVAVDPPRPFDKTAPLDRHHVFVLACAYVVLLGTYTAVGFAITQWWDGSSAGGREADLNRWFEGHRTEHRNQIAEWGSALSNTETKIALMLMLLPLMLWMYRRWHDWAFLTIALLFEVSVFGVSSKIVGRARPPVEQLDGAPTASWPSGHIAASVVFYVGLAIVVSWHTRWWLSRAVFILIAIVAPAIVITARLYQGMHYVTDAVGGVVLAFMALLLVREMMIRSGRDSASDEVAARALMSPLPGELAALRWVQAWPEPTPTVARWVWTITSTEAALIVAVVPAAWVLHRHRWRGAAAVGVAVLTMLVAQPVLKEAIDRPRPSSEHVEVRTEQSSASFPSGHSMSTTTVWGAAALVAVAAGRPRIAVALCLPIALTAVASSALGAHWPSDAIAGTLLGGCAAIGIAALVRRRPIPP